MALMDARASGHYDQHRKMSRQQPPSQGTPTPGITTWTRRSGSLFDHNSRRSSRSAVITEPGLASINTNFLEDEGIRASCNSDRVRCDRYDGNWEITPTMTSLRGRFECGLSDGLVCYQCKSSLLVGLGTTYQVSTDCNTPNDNTQTVECSGECRGVIRDCSSSCSTSTNSSQDTTCCDTDKCNNGAPQSSGWVRCYMCAVCAENYESITNKDYSYCQGQCLKSQSESKVLGATIKVTTRTCADNCKPGKQGASFGSLVSVSGENFCCATHDCNGGMGLRSYVGLLAGLLVVIFGIL
ncbi:hypothetical protein LSH36_316g02027 [Paralvinella palmiformis]|uniref:Uncharacterized protein n=1 Tax=Paralvinella palmiformis TaxID=53620 RepID=A0AAD9JHG5_9ANNE|nr:hypothetical protein LSH36_316g02027 [Paralvinella palmiformis]